MGFSATLKYIKRILTDQAQNYALANFASEYGM